MASKKSTARTASIKKADLPAAGPATEPGATPQNNRIPNGIKSKATPIREIDGNAGKDMSPEAVAERRSIAQKRSQANRIPRVTTVADRAKELKVVTAKEGDQTADGLLREVYSARGEYLTKVGNNMVQINRADVIRQLKSMPADAKSPYKLVHSETDALVHVLEGA